MKNYPAHILSALIAMSLGAVGLHAADEPPANLGKAADNKIYAQKLVNEVMKANSDLAVIGIHVTVPGAKDQTMIATNLDRVGKPDDDDDKAVATEFQTILSPNLKDATKYEVLLPLKEQDGKIIGAVGLVYTVKANDNVDEVKMHAKGVKIRDSLQKKIPNIEGLLKPAE